MVDRLTVLARQVVVDAFDHPVPVHQQVEGNHRRHQDDGQEVDKSQPAGPDLLEHANGPALGILAQIGQSLIEEGALFLDLGQQPRHQGFRLIHVAGGVLHKLTDLIDQQRQHQKDRDDDRAQRNHSDHDRREHPAEALRLEPVGNRVGEIGNRRAQHEGQQSIRQQPEQDDEYGKADRPIAHLFAYCHAIHPSMTSCRARTGPASSGGLCKIPAHPGGQEIEHSHARWLSHP